MLTQPTCLSAGEPLPAEAVNFVFAATFKSFWISPVQYVPGVLSPVVKRPEFNLLKPSGYYMQHQI